MHFNMNWFPQYHYILGSRSSRRQQLLHSLGIEFEVKIKEVNEIYPEKLPVEEIPVFLSRKKAEPFRDNLKENELLITADTIVCYDSKVLGKPANKVEARNMLRMLSENVHQVITGVCLTSIEKQTAFYATSNVEFKKLSENEIDFYITNFKPFDKAGAYGIQEWIGTIGITHIEGSFYNVMGLPIQKLYEEIQKF
jgi:septum formation protein